MTNAEIIQGEILARGITQEVDTYAGWKRKGFKVKKGSKATFKTKIWKPKTRKIKDKDGKETDKKEKYFIMVKAYYFTKAQVEPIDVKNAG